jgi:hypothetical protein
MGRKVFILICLIVTVLSITGALAEAQQHAKVAKIGFLAAGGLGGVGSGSELFKRELRALGYVEGKNIAIEYRSTEGKRTASPLLPMSWSVSKLT